MKITACLVVYNEEPIIESCLKSLKGAVDEIVVVHDGPCRDRTLDICRKYTKKVFVRPHKGENRPHMPFCISKASGSWILQIDADESLSDNAQNNLRNLPREDVAAYELAWEFRVGNKTLKRIGLGNSYKLCFYRKGAFEFRGVLHEIPQVRGKVKRTNLLLRHRPAYDNTSFETFRKKWLRWAGIQAAEYVKSGKARLPRFAYLFRGMAHFAYYFIHYYSRGFVNGWIGFRFSVLQGLYNFYVNYYIMRNYKKASATTSKK